ncbi:Succinylglutamate desuccinylase / Aspartoacylase family protein [Verrucomicrobium sp. GAS474]|uniref:M14 family metallopeptidase n=1 Tax=Verrucomicrobium sp. GAS474 TaxID=1882831 RepID=UPI000879FCB6|nr:M14 family metallocarboxypeptidase [Verrucomicrobium sp. GAS474]SDU02598.1 Succinylglutamate desuccinylase / Aspartoacylase family protein [Verrucomicrobium sp. GAS474]
MHAPNLHLLPRIDFPTGETADAVESLLRPFHLVASASDDVISGTVGRFRVTDRNGIPGKEYSLPRFIVTGPEGGDRPIRIGIFGGLHGDEPESILGLLPFFRSIVADPELIRGYVLFLYPLVNPTGYERGTRASATGKDLNREFWSGSEEPEVFLIEQELIDHRFDGIVSLHADSDSRGVYGYARGATLSAEILAPALRAAAEALPHDPSPVIDGWPARDGIITEGYEGILSAPDASHHATGREQAFARGPQPFEIVFETPQQAPVTQQVEATRLALLSILDNYRTFIAFSQNL